MAHRSSRATRRLIGTIIGALVALGLATGAAFAQQKPLKKVRIAVGTTNLNIAYPWLMMPLALDYWKAEGLEVEVLPVGASLQALQQMVAGNAEFAQLNSSVVIQANVVNNIPARVVMNTGVIEKWGGPLLNHLIYARRPTIFRAVRGMWSGIEASGLIDGKLQALINRRVAFLNGCEF